jgi:acetyl-CoA acyltransferase
MSKQDAYIIECVRTPIGIGKPNGALHNVHPVNLLSQVLDAVTSRVDVNKALVEDVICGCVTPLKEQGSNIPRLALLKAGYPVTVPGVQLNRMCGSGQQAVQFAAQGIECGDNDVMIGCGIEMMSVVPMGADADPLLFNMGEDQSKIGFAPFPYKLVHQGYSADLIAEKYGISRQELNEFSADSHRRSYEARQKGIFKREILPIKIKKGDKEVWFTHDEGVRYPVDMNKLASLPTIFRKNGFITAGHASQISDGAAAVLLMSGKKADELGLKKRARIVAKAVVGCDPVMMLDGVIPATRAVLRKANMSTDQIDIFEVNEAFASVVLALIKTLNIPREKVNPNGGAIAHGHPLGATGSILITKLVHELERTNKRFGLVTMCIGHGQAVALIIENCSYNPNPKL